MSSNSPLRFVLLFGFFSFLLSSVVMGYNYFVDPMCYFRCSDIDLNRKTQNVYYHAVQTLAANADAEVLILGSSRGERVPPAWVTQAAHAKAINLSQGGADLILKMALSNIALERNPNLKRIIWMADYFELLAHTTDKKVLWNPTLRKYAPALGSESQVRSLVDRIKALIDHNTFEAGLALTSAKSFEMSGNGAHLDAAICSSENYLGKTPPEMLKKEIDVIYPLFSSLLLTNQTEYYLKLFIEHIRSLEKRGVEVVINIAPYHRDFEKRLFMQDPHARERLAKWVEEVESLRGGLVKILNYSNGIPGDDGGVKFWEDGVHPTCYAAIQMLKAAF